MKILTACCFLLVLLSTANFMKIGQHQLTKNILGRHLQTSGTVVTSEPTTHTQWKTELLNGLTQVAKKGQAGQAVVYGLNSAVVAVGDTVNDVFMAAAELGSGRIVVWTHSVYLDKFSTNNNSDPNVKALQGNARNWATRGATSANSECIDASKFLNYTDTAAALVKCLYSSEPRTLYSEAQKDKILNFVQNGGALLLAVTPWGWVQLKGTNDWNLMLTYKTLLAAGISWTENLIWGSSIFYFNKTTYLSHLGIQTNIVMSPKNSASFNYSISISVASQIMSLPDSEKAKLQAQIEGYITAAQIQAKAPTMSYQVGTVYQKCRLTFYQYIVLERAVEGIVAPGIDGFPGKVDQSNPNFAFTNQTFTFTAPGYEEYHHTGYYGVAGKPVIIEIIGSVPSSYQWEASVGFHYDDDSKQAIWIRWPTVFRKTTLKSAVTTIYSPYGGLIVLKSPSGTNATLQIKISNIVEAPFYDSQNTTSVSDWSRRKEALGAWGCAKGLYVGFCLPRASFASVADPTQVLDFYDQMYIAYHQLRGTNISNFRRQYYLADISPSVGYMHSGYPVVTQLDVSDPTYSQFFFNYSSLVTLGQWGAFHEIGHNMQRNWWTPIGTGEVTNNIFSLKATQMAIGKSPKYSPWLGNQKSKAKNYLLSPNFSTWKNEPGIALMIYAQVIEDYGWDVAKRVFTWYETNDSSRYPTDDQGKMDLFWARYSLEAGEDLSPLLTKWGIPYTSAMTNLTSSLPAYTQKVDLFAP